jgi:shikimate dehydrogenase
MVRRAAVLGSPISHSRSPDLHRAAYQALGLDWRYDAIEVTPDELPAFMEVCSAPEWAGLSLTMPLKAQVLPLLDSVSDRARLVGAANTVVFDGSARVGHNTDVGGVRRSLEEASGGPLHPTSATIVGGGATARSALAAVADMGATSIDVVVRDTQRATAMVELGSELGVELVVLDWSHAQRALMADVVVATIPSGAGDSLVGHVPETPGVLLDVAYGDERVTPLVEAWRRHGGVAADGLDLLLWQAVEQVRLFTGRDAPVVHMSAALGRPRT